MNFFKFFEEIGDFIYSNDGLSSQQSLDEIVKILFVKIFDERTNFNKLDEENNFYKINCLFNEVKQTYSDVFDENDKINLSETSLIFIFKKLQNIKLSDSYDDFNGLAFQKLLTHHEKDGNGQFFTPKPVIDFCVNMMQPRHDEKILDPACGSGGFLLSTLDYLKINNKDIDVKSIIEDNLFGFDINKTILRICRIKFLLENNCKTNIIHTNTIEELSYPNKFDLILANPPFGAKINSRQILNNYDMGYKWDKAENQFEKSERKQKNQNIDILFIERSLNMLKDGGRMAIILPNGIFENPTLGYLRNYIRLKADILAIIKLPDDTFTPFGTSIKTSILFLEKSDSIYWQDYPIFFGKITKLGYVTNKTNLPIYKENNILDEDFTSVTQDYNNFKNGLPISNENCFIVEHKDLKDRFDYGFYQPKNKSIIILKDTSKTVRFGDICDIIKIKSEKLKNKEAIVNYIELSDINADSYEIINSNSYAVKDLPSRASYEITEGDIITAIAGNSIGTKKHATALVTKDFNGDICTNGFRVLRNFKIDKFYLLYFLRTNTFLKQAFMWRTGAAIPNISDIDLGNILVTIPKADILEDISNKMKMFFKFQNDAKNIIKTIKNEDSYL